MEKAQSTPGIFLKRGGIQEIWKMYPTIGKEYITFGNSSQQYPELRTWAELENKMKNDTTLVFTHRNDLEFSPPSNKHIFSFLEKSWKAKFYESELISLIQSKIID